MDLRQLSYFLGVVDHGGFGKAAESLHISQPSLSQTLKALEGELGVRLFHRVGRGVRLSEAGAQLVSPARQALRALDIARDAVQSTKSLVRGCVDLISMPSPAIEPLTGLLKGFVDAHPGMSVDVRAAFDANQVTAAVRSGESELGLLGAAMRPGAPELGWIKIEDQPLVLISPPGTAGRGNILREEMTNLNVVISQRGSLMRQLVDEVLASGSEIRVVAELAHRTSLLPMVCAGIGHTVMPEAWREGAERMGCTVRTIEPRSHLGIWLVHRRGYLSPGAEAFLRIAQEQNP